MKPKLTNMKREKERKKRKNRYAELAVDKVLYMLKINCKGKRTVGKANKGINVEKITIGLKT